jgi:hypothetical protein
MRAALAGRLADPAAILADPALVLDDCEVMAALIAPATAAGRNVVDLRGALVSRLEAGWTSCRRRTAR